jgi:bifunctional non-homologous end joining protein LigD
VAQWAGGAAGALGDGEGVVCRPDGMTDFERLWATVARENSREAFLYAFDLLELDGTDLRHEPCETRLDDTRQHS